MLDTLIIGGSAAGTAAAIYAARRNLNFLLISKDFGGEVATSGEIENYPGFPHTDGIELVEKFREHLEKNKVQMELDAEVVSITQVGDHFAVTVRPDGMLKAGDKLGVAEATDAKQYEARTIIYATGVHPRELNAPGERELRAKGLSYCTVCDGPLFPKKTVVTIGGGNSALESAIMLSGIASKVFVLNKNPAFKGDQVLIDKLSKLPNVEIIYNAQTAKILGDKFVSAVEYKDPSGETKTIEAQGVFVHIGMVPNGSCAPAAVEKNQFGEIKTNCIGETNLPGFYAAGDVTDIPFKQIGIAVGQGIAALLAAVSYLNKLPH
ncbi:FAD-dependent oxidoreductase [Candidatus Parcubacteria bacterium]|nr:FAD-dependent oxidoreductase [Candidatus Parcubacteria bacterium]